MSNWWKDKWGKDAVCGITLTRLRPGKTKDGVLYVTKIKCGHRFYTMPLVGWIHSCLDQNQIPTCPTCRHEIDKFAFGDLKLGFRKRS
jgi:hypothetical protein